MFGHDLVIVRSRLELDVRRLARAAGRLLLVDEKLATLRRHLEARAAALCRQAAQTRIEDVRSCEAGEGTAPLWRAQAQATAELARRAVMAEVIASSSPIPLVAAMAVGRWVLALRELSPRPSGRRRVRLHVEAGRIASRVLVVWKRRGGVMRGVGRLTSAVVVAEFAHPADLPWAELELERGLARALESCGGLEDVCCRASDTLRTAARLLEETAERAEPLAEGLLAESTTVERRIERALAEGRS